MNIEFEINIDRERDYFWRNFKLKHDKSVAYVFLLW